MLNGFGTIVQSLGKRVKPYLPQICGTILWRLNNKAAKVRQQAADLIAKIAPIMKTCQEVRFRLHLFCFACTAIALLFRNTVRMRYKCGAIVTWDLCDLLVILLSFSSR